MGKKTSAAKPVKDGSSTRIKGYITYRKEVPIGKLENITFNGVPVEKILSEHPTGKAAVEIIKKKTKNRPKTKVKTRETPHCCISCLYYISTVEFFANDHACDECVETKKPIGRHTGEEPLCAKILLNFQRCDIRLSLHKDMDHEFHIRDNK